MNKEIKVCHGFTCQSRQAKEIKQELQKQFGNVQECGCTDNCEIGNNVVVGKTILHYLTARNALAAVKRELDKQDFQKELNSIGISDRETEDVLGL